jgi:hypothetical protein
VNTLFLCEQTYPMKKCVEENKQIFLISFFYNREREREREREFEFTRNLGEGESSQCALGVLSLMINNILE